ncbi:MAG: DNA gyrase subunit A [Coriobacteriales bacterium]|nr:DNA gyrase subunit A [Coriobacteriales bacterium]
MQTSFMEYAMSVIVARALPDVRDGLKPVHRRILYAMNESGYTPNKAHVKSARAVGDCMGRYHPHGDAAIYDTMVRLTQNFTMREPLIDGHGNFGSIDGDGAAAMRYTEARLNKAAMKLLEDLEKDTIDWQPNYDESLQEPKVLPARFPNLIVNGSSGIAVGMATNIPPHNLGESIDAAIAVMENPDIELPELMKILPGPDFPTGATIMGQKGIFDAYSTGRGSITIRSKAHIEETSGGKKKIVVTEIPYQVNKTRLIEKIAELVKDKKITEISGLNDESDRKGMRIVIDLKRGEEPQVVLNNLYKHTQLQTSFGIINLALVDGVPRVLTLKEMLYHYITHQKDVIVRRTKYDLKKAEERAHILEGYVIALENIDEVIEIIKKSKDDAEAREKLTARFGLSLEQTNAILEMKLRRLTGLEREKIENELKELLEKIAYYKKVLGSEEEVKKIIKTELLETKDKFANPRRSDFNDAPTELEVEDLIADEDMVVTITQGGYIKRIPVATYRMQKRGGKGVSGINLKENDFVEQLFVASTHDYVMFFSSKGKVYKLKVHQLPLGSRHSRGNAIVNLLPYEKGETTAAVISTRDYGDDEYLLFCTSHGMVKKTAFSAYKNVRQSGLIAIKLKEDDELISVKIAKPGHAIILVSSAGKAAYFKDEEVRAVGRDASGVRGMKVDTAKGDRVLGLEIASDEDDLFVITENGYGKRTPIKDYNSKHRGGKGVDTIKKTDKKGSIACMKIINDSHDLMIISEEGVMIRVKATDISRLGRVTQGVKVMNLNDNDRVVAVARMSTGNQQKKASDATAGQTSIFDKEISGPQTQIQSVDDSEDDDLEDTEE